MIFQLRGGVCASQFFGRSSSRVSLDLEDPICISRCIWFAYWPSFHVPHTKLGARNSVPHWLDWGDSLDLFVVRLKDGQ
jgi:hypothetical protein